MLGSASLTLTTFSAGSILLGSLLIVALAWCTRKRELYFRSRGCPLPPGPRRWPVIGNLFDVPSGEYPWKAYANWSSMYGSKMIYLQVLRTPMLVISSAKVAVDLMEKRSSIYSDKPAQVIDEITAWDFNLGIMPYGPRWRGTRRVFHQYFNQLAVHKYHGHHIREVRTFLRRALNFENELNPLDIRQALASVILDVVYGLKISGADDEYIRLSSQAVEIFSEGRRPGALWIDFVPFIRYIPAWVPGAAAARLGARCRLIIRKMVNMPFDSVKYGKGDQDCIALDMLTRIEHESDKVRKAEEEQYARDAAGIAYGAGIDTTTITLSTFFCAMAMHPEIQAKAQRDLDNIVGAGRLPEFDDRDSLPYIQAILLECLRWLPALPLGLAHKLTTDDYYGGYFIPRGTIVISNVWAMSYDTDDYPEPGRFNPDRFMKDGKLNLDVRDPGTVVFGFGRRICAGRHFAKDLTFIAMASILHVFDIVPSLDENGDPVDPTPRPTTGAVSQPDRLRCMLQPRSAAAEKLINASA